MGILIIVGMKPKYYLFKKPKPSCFSQWEKYSSLSTQKTHNQTFKIDKNPQI
jgi:hypothetical protein